MIAAPSRQPTITRAPSPRRRATFRMASRRSVGERIASWTAHRREQRQPPRAGGRSRPRGRLGEALVGRAV